MKRKPALLLALSLCSISPTLNALGLGDIELRSSLNQPLDARIALKSWQPGELDDLKVHLAGREHFHRAGVERVSGLSDLVFQVVESPDGSAYIEVSTKADFREPFVDFLVEVSWPQGRVLREYTLLLDPPLYEADVADSVERPSVASPVKESSEGIARKPSPLTHEEERTPVTAVPTSASEQATDGARQASAPTLTSSATDLTEKTSKAVTYGPTAAGDSLWEVATNIVGDSSDEVNRLMLALYRANPDAFLEKNINLLKKGVILQIPDQAVVSAIESNEALAEVKRHHALWDEYRQMVATETGNLPSGALPSAQASSNGQGYNKPEIAGEQVKLLSAGSASSGVGSGGDAANNIEGLRNELALAVEDAEATKRENQDLRERLGETEVIIQDLRRLIELKNDAISSFQHQLAATNSVVSASAAQSTSAAKTQPSEMGDTELAGGSAGSSAENTQPSADLPGNTFEQQQTVPENASGDAATEVMQPSSTVAPVSLPKQDLATSDATVPEEAAGELTSTRPMAIGVGLLGGLLVAGSGFAMWRRRRARADGLAQSPVSAVEADTAPEDVFESTTEDAEALEQANADETLTQASPDEGEVSEGEVNEVEVNDDEAISSSLEVDLMDEDPLAEVNVYLAYERFAQAEQLVKEAVAKYPARQEYKLKLLEIFAASKNADAFATHARLLREAVGDENPLLEKALTWWRELCPERELFADDIGERNVISTVDDEEATADGGDALDNLLADDDAAVGSDTVHLKPGVRVGAEARTAVGTELDFDLGSELTQEAVSGEQIEGTVDFELGLEAATDDAFQPQDELDFALSRPEHHPQDLGETEESEAKFDLSLDDETVSSKTIAEGTIDFDLSSLDLSESSSASTGNIARESGADETIDLDYSFEDSKEESLEDGLEDLEFSRTPEEGTVDFDLGLLESNEDSQTVKIETMDRTTKQDAWLDEAEIEGGGEAEIQNDEIPDDILTTMANLDGHSGDALDEKGTEHQPPMSPEQEEVFDPADSFKDALAEAGIDLELEPDDLVSGNAGDAAVETHDAVNEAIKTDVVQQDSQDEVLNTWADLEGASEEEADRTLVLDKELSQDLDEIQTKLELAQAYMDMGDAEGARSILDEVVSEGDSDQKQAAMELIAKLA